MKILAVSDVESKYIWEHFDPEVFRGVNLMLACGDLKASYLSYLVTMIPAPLFYVPGNHDNAYAKNPPDGCESVDGRVLEYRGLRIAGLGGCLGTDPTNPLQYSEEQMAKRVKKLSSEARKRGGVDIFLSHAPAAGIGDGSNFHEGFQCFHDLHREFTPKLHLYGHLHRQTAPGSDKNVFHSGDTTLMNCTGYRLFDWQSI